MVALLSDIIREPRQLVCCCSAKLRLFPHLHSPERETGHLVHVHVLRQRMKDGERREGEPFSFMRPAHKLHLALLLKPQTLLARIQSNGHTWIQESLRKVTFILTGHLLNYEFQFYRRRKQSLGIAISFCHASCLRQCRGQDLLLTASVLSEAWGSQVGKSLTFLTKAQLGGIPVGLRDLAAQALLFK